MRTVDQPAEESASAMYNLSAVEQWYLAKSGRRLSYPPTERAAVIEVSNFPTLGRLTALRFLEWVLENPEGVVSLPTGKTPEYFIRWTQHYLAHWTQPQIQSELAAIGINAPKPPVLSRLHFVQIDEFYPIDPAQHNSFYYYVQKHYIKGFGLDPERAMCIDASSIGLPTGKTLDEVFPGGRVDLSLRSRNAQNRLEEFQQTAIMAVDQFCSEYEEKVRAMGGLGFFLGGVGPDGHIGFNPRGSHLYAPTRLTYTNYETEAAAASDLGGIEVSRSRPVITIGLGTITYNRDAVVLVFAAGDAKSHQVEDAIQHGRDVRWPATALQGMPHARFYLTHGASIRLIERRIDDVLKAEKISEETLERALIDRSLSLGRRLEELREGDAAGDRLLSAVLEKTGRSIKDSATWTRDRLLGKIERGLDDLEGQTILHTGPHHDDIMLGYMPYVMHLVRRASNNNMFYILTSGFNAVTNTFLAELLEDVRTAIAQGIFNDDLRRGALDPALAAERSTEVFRFLDGIASRDENARRRAQARRTLVNLIQVYEDEDLENISDRIGESLNYLNTLYPGKKDIPLIQRLKGMQREYEEELIWAYVGTNPDQVHHGRLGFYTGDMFTEQPTVSRDVAPVLAVLEHLKPSVVSLAFDPEGAGPDTHYKVLQVLHEALIEYQRRTGQSPTVWGYRNVWHRFHPAESNIFVPATLNTMAIMEHSFLHCMGSQRSASFPSYEYDGPFCYLAQRLWVEQFKTIQSCLGERFFIDHKHPRLRATRGFVFLHAMSLEEFSGKARRLAELTEAADAGEGDGQQGEGV